MGGTWVLVGEAGGGGCVSDGACGVSLGTASVSVGCSGVSLGIASVSVGVWNDSNDSVVTSNEAVANAAGRNSRAGRQAFAAARKRAAIGTTSGQVARPARLNFIRRPAGHFTRPAAKRTAAKAALSTLPPAPSPFIIRQGAWPRQYCDLARKKKGGAPVRLFIPHHPGLHPRCRPSAVILPLPVPPHETLHPLQGDFDLVVGRGVAAAHEARAAGAEGRAGHDGHLFFHQ